MCETKYIETLSGSLFKEPIAQDAPDDLYVRTLALTSGRHFYLPNVVVLCNAWLTMVFNLVAKVIPTYFLFLFPQRQEL